MLSSPQPGYPEDPELLAAVPELAVEPVEVLAAELPEVVVAPEEVMPELVADDAVDVVEAPLADEVEPSPEVELAPREAAELPPVAGCPAVLPPVEGLAWWPDEHPTATKPAMSRKPRPSRFVMSPPAVFDLGSLPSWKRKRQRRGLRR